MHVICNVNKQSHLLQPRELQWVLPSVSVLPLQVSDRPVGDEGATPHCLLDHYLLHDW